MINVLQRNRARYGVHNSILLFIYLAAVFAADFYLEPTRKTFYISVLLGLLVFCPIIIWLLSRFPGVRTGGHRCIDTRGKRMAWISAFFAVSFGVLVVWYLSYYPMSLSNDTLDQYAQAVSGAYSDWHPALHTLLVFTLPLTLTGNAGSIILIQIIAFSAALAYMGYTLLTFGSPLYAIAALLLVLCNPNTGSIATFPMKDVTFAIGAIFVFSMGLQIWFTQGEWAKSWRRLVALILALTVTSVVRHNAILFTLPFLVALLLLIGKRQRFALAAGFLLCMALVKGVLYPALRVEKPGLRQLEMLGLPMTVISNVAKEHPERLNEQSRAFLDSVAPPESWRQFAAGSFNSYKWMVNLAAIEQAGAKTVLSTAWDCVRSDPRDAFTSLILLTRMVYAIDGSGVWYVFPNEATPLPGPYRFDTSRANPKLRAWVDDYFQAFATSPAKYVALLGTVHAILLACLLGRTDWKSAEDWKRLLLCVPLIIHNFGTMLLLSGADYRFFYLSFPLCPAMVFLLLHARRDNGR